MMKALVVDDEPAMRGIIEESLHRLGVQDIVMAATAGDALKSMRVHPAIDLVLCDHNLGRGTNGQQLLEAARGCGMLGPLTAWVFVSASSIRADVMTAGDQAPDGYIVKPFTDTQLGACIRSLWDRKSALAPLLIAANAQDWEGTLAIAETFASRTDPLCVEGIKRKAQALMKLGRFEEAEGAYAAALRMNSELGWANLGHAQALRAMGKTGAARSAIEKLLREQPDFAAAYDTLIDMVEEEGDQDAALAVALELSNLIPSARRKVKLGTLALRAGRVDLAVTALEQAVAQNRHAATSSHTEGILLAQALVDSADPARALAVAADVIKQFPEHPAAQMLGKAVCAQGLEHTGRSQEAATLMADIESVLSQQPMEDDDKLLIAKAALATGRTDLCHDIIETVARNNSDRPATVAAALRVAQGSPAEDECRRRIERAEAQTREALRYVRQAKFDGDFARAISIAEKTLAMSPTHFSVLIELCTLHLLAMTRDPQAQEHAQRAGALLAVLESKHPNHDRVAAARKFYRERVASPPQRE